MSLSSPPPQHPGYAGAGTDVAHSADGIDIIGLAIGVWRRKFLIGSVVAIAVIGAAVLLTLATPKFTSEARVLVEDRESGFSRISADQARAAPPDNLAIRSQVEVLLSEDLALGVIDKLDLTRNFLFNPDAKPSLTSRLLSMVGLGSTQPSAAGREGVLNVYFENLTVYPIPQSRVISVGFTSPDPKVAAAVVNTLVEHYVEATREAKFETTKRATEWLARQIENLRRKVASSEAAVEEFRASSGLTEGALTTLNRQELSEINTQISVAAAAKSDAQSRASSIRNMLKTQGGVDAAPEVLSSRLIQRLGEQQAALRRRIADLSVTYLPEHPNMKRLSAELIGLDRQVRREALKIVEGLEEEARAAGDREQSVREKLNKLKTQAALSSQDGIRLKALERDATANRQLFESFLNRYREASTRESITSLPAGARIISRAQVRNTPSSPKKMPIMILAFVGALTLGILIAFLAECFGPVSGRRPGQLAGNGDRYNPVGVGVAGTTPVQSSVAAPAPIPTPMAGSARLHEAAPMPARSVPPQAHMQASAPPAAAPTGPSVAPGLRMPNVNGVRDASELPREVVYDDRSVFSEAILALHETIAGRLEAKARKRVAVTAARSGQGRTTVSAGLARSFARSGFRTLVIDADFGAPSLMEAFNIPRTGGLSELLLGQTSFRDIVQRDVASGADVLGAGFLCQQTRELLASQRMDIILEALDNAYDRIVIDAPTLLDTNEGSIVGRFSSSVVLLLNVADVQEIDRAAMMLAGCGCDDIMPVHTHVLGQEKVQGFGQAA